LINFGWVLDGRLAGSGVVHPEESGLLLEQGIRALLSLTERNPADGGGFPAEIAHVHLPIPDFSAPGPETRDRAMTFVERNLAEDRPVLVHCGAGYGRTGTILACYLVHGGEDPDEAIRIVRARRPGSIETLAQERAVRLYAVERGERREEEP
jgi:atypical dual specificity phosphatase